MLYLPGVFTLSLGGCHHRRQLVQKLVRRVRGGPKLATAHGVQSKRRSLMWFARRLAVRCNWCCKISLWPVAVHLTVYRERWFGRWVCIAFADAAGAQPAHAAARDMAWTMPRSYA